MRLKDFLGNNKLYQLWKPTTYIEKEKKDRKDGEQLWDRSNQGDGEILQGTPFADQNKHTEDAHWSYGVNSLREEQREVSWWGIYSMTKYT